MGSQKPLLAVENVKMKSSVDRRAILFEEVERAFALVCEPSQQAFGQAFVDRRRGTGRPKDDARARLRANCDGRPQAEDGRLVHPVLRIEENKAVECSFRSI